MGFSITNIVLVISAFQFAFAEQQCHSVELGTCVDHVVDFINSFPRRQMPQEEAQMNKLCSVIHSATECFDDYRNRCMSPLQKEIEKLITQGARDYNAEFCAPGSAQIQAYLRNSKCLNDVLNTDEADDAANRGVAMFETINKVSIFKLPLYMCCGWNLIFSTLKNMATDRCGSEAANSVDEILAAAVSTLPSMFCEKFDPSSEECTAILPPTGTKPSGIHNPVVDAFRYVFGIHV